MRARPALRGRGWRHATIAIVALMLAALVSPALAQEDDLPGRVGRLADFAGQILMSSQDRPDEWEPIGVNYPITSGVNLWVSADGRAEIDYGGGQVRLAGDTNVHVARLDDRELSLFVAQGRVLVRVRVQDPGESTRVDTPNAQLALLRPGLYRVEVAPDRQETMLIVREGEGNVALMNEVRQVLPGQAVSVAGDPVTSNVRYAQGVDGFDSWSASRDRRYEGSRASSYVSRQMVGAADLDTYGAWQSMPEYGPVWFPYTVAPDWAPYRDGYWANVGGWGPTWVDSAPWGYAPFHYGRWAFIGGRWGWCPGGYVARPVWAPALVAWYGGPGWGLVVSGGRPLYGWVPLGWREPYYPNWRRCSANCWTRYNRPYGVNVTAGASGPPLRHVNLAVPGALSAVPATALVGRAPVRSNLVPVPGDLASSATAMRTAPPFRAGERQVPSAPSATANLPRAASTYARAPRSESTSTVPFRTATPVRASPVAPATAPAASATLFPPIQRETMRPSPAQAQRAPETNAPSGPTTYAPRRTSPPPTEVPPQRAQVRSAPPQAPSQLPAGIAPNQAMPPVTTAPRAAPSVAPAPSAPPPQSSGPTRSSRGAERSVPEAPSAEPRR